VLAARELSTLTPCFGSRTILRFATRSDLDIFTNKRSRADHPACQGRSARPRRCLAHPPGLAGFAIVESYLSTARNAASPNSMPSATPSAVTFGNRPDSGPPDSSTSGRSRPCHQGVAAWAARSIRWHRFGNSGLGQPTRIGRGQVNA
jgi:hypothetical protein